ncbi:fungal zn(2)-Cys(6) binuclear cluster domain-containing protein [Hirsutella rhossiliensis]|uniref:Fungal zn(2)-Cys(6) binuclear cluster domain-containing protein n=1 Tax=Hirsutella rhossiliensis TaxID=111463 RepID=A0A9P8MVF7_9HYPO|nr:fungal zn(2)-Cys(6) binuclear cluster domain-containing protein [Hirsutella rhossiliensis]KAH0961990.1 fungal zn(2)-Cys(6) binuclear cluster domain-containing protein [Hirsutella rhossiliensis]
MYADYSSEPGTGNMPQPQQRRKRMVISCNECHRRKQRCDRRQPCSNCTKRDKVHLCFYENQEPHLCFYENQEPEPARASPASDSISMSVGARALMPQPGGSSSVDNSPASQSQTIVSPTTTAAAAAAVAHQNAAEDLGFSITSTDTLNFIRQITGSEQHASASSAAQSTREPRTTREARSGSDMSLQYRNVVRQLPPKRYADILVRSFFVNTAWHYDVLDSGGFEEQLACWYRVPYTTLSHGPLSMPPEIRLFPALLFQVLAQALLFQPMGSNDALNDLKYAPGMTYPDLAMEYSDAGNTIMAMLGSRDSNMVKVHAGLLQVSFQRSTGSIIEAWHSLGSTIRDAQEMGLHCIDISPEDLAMSSPEQLRELETRRKMWLVLHLWDGYMGVVLGRPMSTKLDHGAFAQSLDSIYGMKAAVTGDDERLWVERHQPTPFAVLWWLYHAAGHHLQDIHKLESAGASQERYPMVQKIHAAIVDSMRRLPDWARVDHPNTDWDRVPSCFWLSAARETLETELCFVLLALHRPYIFSVPASRNEALKAALQILESQGRLFSQTKPREYVTFNLVFATFDAMVLVASIYILYPHENALHVDASVRGIEWGLARLDAMRVRNKMAGSAFDTAQTMYGRFRRRLAGAAVPATRAAMCSLSATLGPGSASGPVRPSGSAPTPATLSPHEAPIPHHGHDHASEALGFTHSLDALLPPQPLHDLVFQHLPGTADSLPLPVLAANEAMPEDFWRLMSALDG